MLTAETTSTIIGISIVQPSMSVPVQVYVIPGELGVEITVEPTLLLKNSTTTTQFDIGMRATWDDKFWFGSGYRDNGEISALAGYTIQERYIIGYSYDMLNKLGPSHEFVLGIRFLPLRQEEIIK